MLAQQLVDGFITGLHRSPYHGFSVEFSEHKLYNFGENTKHIDWKIFGRTDRLYNKKYAEETNLRCHLIVDQSSSMHYPVDKKDKLRFAVIASASIANLLIRQRDAVGLTIFSDKIDYQCELKSTKTHLHRLFEYLGKTLESRRSRSTSISSVLHEISEKVYRRSLIVLFTDMFQKGETDEIFVALQHLKHNLNEVIVFHISDYATEMEFEFSDQPSKFIDLETKEVIKLNPYQVKHTYRSEMYNFYKAIKIRCGMLGIDFVDVDIADPFDKILGSFLTKRKKMR